MTTAVTAGDVSGLITPLSVVKHSAVIHMSNCLTPMERKIYNVLLFNARETMARGVDHEIETTVLEESVRFSRNNRTYLITTTEGLRDKQVRYNIFEKDCRHAEVWQMNSGLVAEVGFNSSRTRCKYSFPNSLIDLLHNPNLFARINLNVQIELKGAHSLPLYEFYLDMLGGYQSEREFVFKLNDMRHLLELGPACSDFKILHRNVLKRAHDELNAKSDICVEIVAFNRVGRSVESLQIAVRRKTAAVQIPQAQTHQTVVKQANMEGECGGTFVDGRMQPSGLVFVGDDHNISAKQPATQSETNAPQSIQLEQNLRRYFQNGRDIDLAIATYAPDYIKANISYVTSLESSGKVKNRGAYLRVALQQNYAKYVEPKATGEKQSKDLDKPVINDEHSNLVSVIRERFATLPETERENLLIAFEHSKEYQSFGAKLRSAGRKSPIYRGQLINFLIAHEHTCFNS